MDVVIVNYGAGNIQSIKFAFKRLGCELELSADPDRIRKADKVIFPGVGEASSAMRKLEQSGLDNVIPELKQPVLGICLGMQALFEYSEEGDSTALGIFPGAVKRFRRRPELKIPHMGWNTVDFSDPADPSVQGIALGDQFYFVHSYRVETGEAGLVWGETDYGERFVSAVRQGNCFATQFHPEKSQAKGLQIYRNFVESVRSF